MTPFLARMIQLGAKPRIKVTPRIKITIKERN